jgi:ubiquinone biosynthesis protein UbiJ
MRELTREVNRLSADTRHLEERLNALHRKMAVQTS